MKRRLTIGVALLFCLTTFSGTAQYYFKGSVVNEKNEPVAFVKFKLLGRNETVETGGTGIFGFASRQPTDSAIVFANGYDTAKVLMRSDAFLQFVLQPSAEAVAEANRRSRRNSLSPGVAYLPAHSAIRGGETYNVIVPNGFVSASEYPETGFSPNANQASYTNTRRYIRSGQVVPVDGVRPEEMINYFDLRLSKEPPENQKLVLTTAIQRCPWNANNQLLFANVVSREMPPGTAPPANFVLLIDNSGSMETPERLPMLKAGIRKMVRNMREEDRIAIVTYGGAAGIRLPPTYGSHKDTIIAALDAIQAGGATPGSNGIRLAYELATTNAVDTANNRIILATDGDFNVGAITEKELEELISNYSHTGVYLTCFGVGMGNYKDSKIEVLAKFGKGNFGYLDTEEETDKAFTYELTHTLPVVAGNLKVYMQLNSAAINNYRLIGYDNNAMALQNESNELMGGQLMAGTSVLTLLEIEPVDNSTTTANWGTMHVSYETTDSLQQEHISIPIRGGGTVSSTTDTDLASCVAWLAELLRNSPYTSQSFAELEAYASGVLKPEDAKHAELLQMITAAVPIYEPPQDTRKGRKPRKPKG